MFGSSPLLAVALGAEEVHFNLEGKHLNYLFYPLQIQWKRKKEMEEELKEVVQQLQQQLFPPPPSQSVSPG